MYILPSDTCGPHLTTVELTDFTADIHRRTCQTSSARTSTTVEQADFTVYGYILGF